MPVTRIGLSNSTSGRMTKITVISSPGIALHRTSSTNIDELWLWAITSSIVPVSITLGFGGVTAPDDLIKVVIPSEGGLHLILPGLGLSGSLLLRAWANAANVISVGGYGLRHS